MVNFSWKELCPHFKGRLQKDVPATILTKYVVCALDLLKLRIFSHLCAFASYLSLVPPLWLGKWMWWQFDYQSVSLDQFKNEIRCTYGDVIRRWVFAMYMKIVWFASHKKIPWCAWPLQCLSHSMDSVRPVSQNCLRLKWYEAATCVEGLRGTLHARGIRRTLQRWCFGHPPNPWPKL